MNPIINNSDLSGLRSTSPSTGLCPAGLRGGGGGGKQKKFFLGAWAGAIIAGLLLSTSSAWATNTKVAVLGAPAVASWNVDVVSKISAAGPFSQVDNIIVGGAGATTPSLATLEQYSAVLVYADGGFADSVTLGNNLASYIDAGGGVVICTFALSSGYMGGRFISGDYSPLTISVVGGGGESTLVADLPDNPILSGVTSFDGGTESYHDQSSLVDGATQVAHWNGNNDPLVAVMGQVVALNFYPPSSDVRSDFWKSSTDGGRLMANALSYVADPLMGETAPSIVTQPASAAVVFGGSTNFTVAATGSSPLFYQWYFIDDETTNSLTGATGATYTIGAADDTSEGDYFCVVTNLFGSVTSSLAVLTVTPATPTISWPAASAIAYSQPLSASSLTGGSASVAGNFAFATPTAVPNAGSPLEWVVFTPSDTNDYDVVSNTVAVTVSPEPLTVTVTNETVVYGSAFPTFTGSLVGVTNNDNLTVSFYTVAGVQSGAGPYNILPAFNDPNGVLANYTVTTNVGTLVIQAAPLGVTADAQTRTYGATNPIFTITYSGLAPWDTSASLATVPVATSTATTASTIGHYPITVSGGVSPNYTFSYTNGTLSVTKASLVVAGANASRPYGATNPVFTATLTGIENGDNLAARFSTTAGTNSLPGQYTIQLTVYDPTGKLGQYNTTLNSGILTITNALLTGTVQDVARQYGQTNPVFTVAYTGFVNSEGTNLLSGDLTFVCTDTNGANVDTNTPVGVYAIDVTNGPTAPNYTVQFVNGTLTVTQAVLTVTAINAQKVYGTANPLLAATITGYQNNDNSNVLSGTLLFTNSADATSTVGAYPITLGGLTATNYALDFVTGTLTVTQAPLAVTVNSTNRLYGQANPTFTGVVTGVLNDDDLGISYGSTATAASAVGTYAIAPAFADPDGRLQNYTLSATNGTLTVQAAPLAVTAYSTNRLYGQTNPIFAGTLVGVVNEDNITASFGSTATAASAVGAYAIVPTLTDPSSKLGNYVVSSTNGTLTVSSATLVVTAASQSRNYGQANAAFTVNYSGLVNGQDATVVSGTPSFICVDGNGIAVGATTPVGVYAIIPGGLTAPNYSLVYSNGSLTINQATLTVTPNAATRTYGATNPVFTATYAGFANSETTNVLSGQPALGTTAGLTSPVGGYNITAALGTLSATNYNFTFNTGTLSVTAAPLSGLVASWERAYGQTNPVFAVTYSGFVNGETTNLITGAIGYSCLDSNAVPVDTNTWVGTYAITVSTPQTAVNYTITYPAGALTVTQAVLLASADPQGKAFGTTNPPLTYTLSGFVNDDGTNVVSGQPVLSTAAVTNSPVGAYPIEIALGTLSATNYSFSLSNSVLTVAHSLLTVTAVNQTRLYGQTNPVLTVVYSGFVDGDDQSVLSGSPTVTTAATTNTGVGSYPITVAVGTLSAENYALSLVPGTLTIGTTPLGIVAQNAARQYGTANPAFSVVYDGLVNGETNNVLSGALTLTSAATVTTDVGAYAIVPAGLTSTNYAISFTNGTLTITQAPLTVVAFGTNRLYGATNPVFAGTVTGVLNSDNLGITFGTTATAASPAGTYSIVPAYSDPENKLQDYAVTTTDGVLTVGATSLTVTADNQTRVYGQTNPVLTVEYSGFVNGDGPSSLATEPTASTAAEPTNAIGQYPITVGGGSSPNYTFTYVAGTLTVTQANLSILGNSVARAYGQTNPVFTSTITGVVNGDDITVSYSTTATPTSAPGNYDIRLVVNDPDGKLGEYSLTLVSGTLTVTNALLLVTVDNQSRLYGQANPAFTAEYSGWVNGQGTNNLSGTLAYSCLDASGHAVKTNTPVGAYTINASGLTATDYSLEFVPGTLTIGATPLTVTGANTNRTYGAANPAFGVTYSGFVNLETSNVLGGTLAITTPAVATSPIGTYAIIPAGLTSSNYSLTFNNGTLAVTPAALAGQVQAEERAYGQTNPVFAVVYNGFVNSETTNVLTGTLTYSCLDTNGAAVNTNTWVGTYPIAVTTPQVDTNYNITYQAGALTVTQAVLLASADPQSRLYGVTNPPLTYTLSGFVNDDGTNVVSGEPVLSTAAVTNSPVGQYVITIEPGALSATNYSFSLTNGVLTVGKAALTVTAVNQTRLYGQTNPVLTVAYSGFVDGDSQSILSGSPAVTTAATTNTGVGSYPIAVAAGTLSAQNYVLTLVNGTLTINATPLDIVAQDATRQYGLPNPAFSASYAGFVNGETNGALSGTLTLTSATDVTTPVGTYAIVPAGVTSTNYTISFTDGTLTVTQALLTVTANNASREYDTTNPVFTGTISGLYNGDPITATYATTATQASPAGTYAIVPSLVDLSEKAGNYSVTLVSGVLTITAMVDNPVGTNVTSYYVVGDFPTQINTNAEVADGGGLNYNGGRLVLTIVSNVTSQDEMTIATEGTGAGEIDLTGTNVTYGGTTFASMAGGEGATPLAFVFNANASTPAVSELLRQVAFYTSNTNQATRTVAVALTVAGNTVVSDDVIIVDRAPVTGPCVITAAFGVTVQIPFSLILTNDYDVDGDALTITDYSDLSAYGAWITNKGTAFSYTPPAGQTNRDLFAYIVSDGRGGSAVGTITLNFVTQNQLKLTTTNLATSGAHLSMAGMPGENYLIQVSTNLVNWSNLETVTASGLGIIQVQDTSATNYTRRFYRAEPE